MNKIIAALIGSVALYSAPIGNTSAPDQIHKGLLFSPANWLDFRAGYEGDFVADGRMNQFDQGSGRVDCYHQLTNSGTVTANILNRWDIYGVFGASKVETDWRFENQLAGTISRIDLHTQYNFLWAVGSRAVLYEWCNTFLGVGGRYSSCHYEPSKFTSDGVQQSMAGAQVYWREWQITLDFCYRIKLFTPYIGVKYLNAKTFLSDFSVPISQDLTGSDSFQNRDPVGLYVGCAISNGNYFMVNLEGRVIDEEAVTVSADFRF